MNDPNFYVDRRRFKLVEQRIFMIQHVPPSDPVDGVYGITVCDPDNNIWERLPPMTKFQEGIIMPGAKCVTVNGKLVLIGTVEDPHICRMMKMDRSEKIRRVFLYDFSKSQWRRCKDMPIVCSEGMSSCAVASCTETGTGRGFIYVAGGYNVGHGHQFGGAAAVYRVEEDEWESLPNMNTDIKGEVTVIDGKFYVSDEFGSGEVFHPDTRHWTTVENRGNPDLYEVVGPCMAPVNDNEVVCWSNLVCVDGRCYCYGFREGVNMEYKSKDCVWKEWAPLDDYEVRSATQWGDNLFFGGPDILRRAVFRMFVPPATEGAQISETVVESPKDFSSWVSSFTTLYI
ncbi:hypothetical protein KI387_042216 [Taxus chinensis]|uniref:F-box/kelch-repeat protein n=1 Tax=Taxus chinensis TaxID=29808 RepID=A0AA38F7G9_TAXCH|nr:hypothetical protein KI387_042216 [Taxus chinensis]